MRSLAAIGLCLAAAILAGCQTLSTSNYNPNANFSSPIFTDFGSVGAWQDQNLPPYVFTFPDETMFFFPIYSQDVRSDLNLRSIRCSRAADGSLVVTARVSNMGANIVQTNREFGTFRIAATVTWAGGTQQEVDVTVPIPMTVPSTEEYSLRRTRYFAGDVTRIDVVADPDRVVPDPVRLNNVLSWEGKMNADSPNCDVTRS
jgi:hypothetical protein